MSYQHIKRILILSCKFGCGIFVFAFLFALTEFVLVADAWELPTSRMAVWTGNVGVEGGIPTRTTKRNCVTSDGAKGNGSTDDTAAIRNCITNTPTGTVAFLPSGTYKVTETITIPSNKTLRGAGIDLTIISAEAGLNDIIRIGAGYTSSTLLTINSGYTKGSTQLVLADASSIADGNYILINELNDSSIPVTSMGYGGSCTWCDQFGGTRLRAQVVKVTNKSGNTITVSLPLFYTFSASNSPKVMKLNTFTEYAGIEDLTVKNGSGASSGKRTNIMFMGVANSWVKNVKVDTCGKRCIDMRTYFYRVEVRDSYITQCVDYWNSDTCYGTQVAEGSNSLVENNIYDTTAMGPMLMWGASGNVVAYNYAYKVHRTQSIDSWFWPNTWTHGAHTSYNLWEGNEMAGLNWDGYWASHSHNTAFRNRFVGKDVTADLVGGHLEVAAIITEKDNNYNNIIGNVLGLTGWSNKYEERETYYWASNTIYATGGKSPGGGDTKAYTSMLRHMNYDYVTNAVKKCNDSGEPGCQGGSSDTLLPASLYLSSKPSWWGNQLWPPIGPDVPGYAASIPAKDRFLNVTPAKTPSAPVLH